MHFFPLERYSTFLPSCELNTTYDLDVASWFGGVDRHNIISIPIGLRHTRVVDYRCNIHTKIGINLDVLNYGGYGFSVRYEDGTSKRFFYIDMFSQQKNVFYPGIFVGYGIDWYTKWAILHVTLNAQKSIFPYMNGVYEFMNLAQSPNSFGTYKLRGDYLGIDLGITLKKFRT